jgi:hypothetical protein
MGPLDMLQSVRFVVDQNGQPAAVQMDIAAWESLLEWLEDVEDREAVKALLPKLRAGPQKSGALRWGDIHTEWDEPKDKR